MIENSIKLKINIRWDTIFYRLNCIIVLIRQSLTLHLGNGKGETNT